MSTKYVPAIDGLRALAIGAVIASHFGADRFIPGGFGVTLFFFISGYLITSLMIREYTQSGTVSISSFYIRRFLRLAPALMTMIITVSLAFFALFGFVTVPQISAAALYYMNYYLILGGQADMPLGPLWSLSVEEHYYLLFPIIFASAWKYRERFLIGLSAVVVAVLLWRLALVLVWHVGQDRTYSATDTRIDSILFGAILAAIPKTTFAGVVKYLDSWTVMVIAATVILITFLYRNDVFRETARYSLQGIALMPLFYSTLFSGRLAFARAILETAPFVWIGKLSYSLYLWHMPVLLFSEKLGFGNQTLAKLTITILLAAISYYGVEAFFQRMRESFRIKPTAQSSATEAVAL
jgi:peptidoglycan/LPS O-acetylase OafA/YrhL